MSITGEPDGPPLKVGVAAVDVLAGVHAAAAILAALVGRFRGGAGAHLDVALFEVGVASLVNVAQSALAGAPTRRHGTAHPQIVPYQTFATADGALIVAVGNDGQWSRLCGAVERPEWASRPEWRRNADRVLHREDVVRALSERFASAPRAAWMTRLRAARVPAGEVREVAEAVRDPVLAARDFVRRVDAGAGDATAGAAALEMLALPWMIDGVRPPLRMPPPRLGEHTREFMERWGE